MVEARTFYDHLAGRLGVGLYGALVDADTLVPTSEVRGDVGSGRAASRVFESLRIGPEALASRAGPRRFAFACPDRTKRMPHLGGALVAVCERFFEEGWVRRLAVSRALDGGAWDCACLERAVPAGWRRVRKKGSTLGRQAIEGRGPEGALLAWGAALVTVVLWASAFVVIRAAGEDLSPGALSLARLLVGSAALGALVLIRRERLPAGWDLPAIALRGVLWFGLYNVALNAAERLVDAGTAAMLVGIGPVLVAVFAGVLLGEGFPVRSSPAAPSPSRGSW